MNKSEGLTVEEELYDTICAALWHRYGKFPDILIQNRVREEWRMIEERRLAGVISTLYKITKELKEHHHPYWLRGCSGSSLILFLLEITSTNPLPPHYYCPVCHQVWWKSDCGDGFDLQIDKRCKHDNTLLLADGHSLPWQTLFGYGEHMPSFDLELPKGLFESFKEKLCEHESTQQFAEETSCKEYELGGIKHLKLSCINMTFIIENWYVHPDFYKIKIDASYCQQILKSQHRFFDKTEKRYEQYDFLKPDVRTFSELITKFALFSAFNEEQLQWYETVMANSYSFLPQDKYHGKSSIVYFRDDVFHYLTCLGFLEKDAWREMERVRKGKGLYSISEILRTNANEQFVSQCNNSKYLFPKAHAIEFLLYRFREEKCKFSKDNDLAMALMDSMPDTHYSPTVLICKNKNCARVILDCFKEKYRKQNIRLIEGSQLISHYATSNENMQTDNLLLQDSLENRKHNCFLLFEDLDFISGNSLYQSAFFHLYNEAWQYEIPMIVTLGNEIHSFTFEGRIIARLCRGIIGEII